jgi:hypothetical protein
MNDISTLTSHKRFIDNGNSLLERNIFICHDGGGFSFGSKGRIDAFTEFLGAFFKRISNDKYNIYHTSLKDIDLNEVIEKSNVFIFINGSEIKENSPIWEQSNLIHKKLLNEEDTTFLIKINHSATLEKSQSSFLSGMKGTNFFESPRGFLNFNMENDESDQNSRVLQGKIADLAFNIDKFFNRIKGHVQDVMPRFAVYLAETTPDQSENRDIIKREIEQFGYQVFPETPLPESEAEFRNAVGRYLEKSIFSVHIIGEEYGTSPIGEVHSKVDLQNKMAIDFMKAQKTSLPNFSRFIWISPDLKVSSDIQRQYIDKLKRGDENLTGAELVQSPLVIFKSLLMNKIDEYHVNKAIVKTQLKDKARIYLIHDAEDHEVIQQISEHLKESNFEPILPSFSEKDNYIGIHRQNLITCDSVLIYYSRDNSFWLKSKLADLMKAPGYGKVKPFTAKAIFLAHPINGLDMSLFDDFIFLSQNKNISLALKPLYDKLIGNNE